MQQHADATMAAAASHVAVGNGCRILWMNSDSAEVFVILSWREDDHPRARSGGMLRGATPATPSPPATPLCPLAILSASTLDTAYFPASKPQESSSAGTAADRPLERERAKRERAGSMPPPPWQQNPLQLRATHDSPTQPGSPAANSSGGTAPRTSSPGGIGSNSSRNLMRATDTHSPSPGLRTAASGGDSLTSAGATPTTAAGCGPAIGTATSGTDSDDVVLELTKMATARNQELTAGRWTRARAAKEWVSNVAGDKTRGLGRAMARSGRCLARAWWAPAQLPSLVPCSSQGPDDLCARSLPPTAQRSLGTKSCDQHAMILQLFDGVAALVSCTADPHPARMHSHAMLPALLMRIHLNLLLLLLYTSIQCCCTPGISTIQAI